MIYPEDNWKGNWDLFITTILIFTCNTTPYMISFNEEKSMAWEVIDNTIDACFFIDIIFNFNQAFYTDDFLIQDNRKEIASDYLSGWFTIDVAAII